MFCELGSRYQFPEETAFMAPDACAYRTPADPERALELLVEKFGEAALVETGVALRSGVHSAEGPLQFASALAGPETPLIVLYGDEDGRPFAVVTAEGCWGHSSPPLLAGMEDRFTASNLRKSQLGYVYVTATVEDMILLRSLGLAAATAAGLARLEMRDVRRLRQHFGLASFPAEEDEDGDDPEAAGRPMRAAEAPEADGGRAVAREAAARNTCWKSWRSSSSPGRPVAGSWAGRPRSRRRRNT